MQRRPFDIAGKDFLTVEEAAHYACVSYSQFRAKAREYGLRPFPWMGKTVYRKDDIRRAMERAAELAAGDDPAPDSPSLARTGFALLAAATEAHERRRRRRG
ncbi:MAG: hypothetical protein AB1651_16545 [Pseudomonadota bacterium]